MRPVYVSTCCLSGTLSERLRALDAAGVRHVELSAAREGAGGERAALRPWRGRLSFLVHNYFPPAAEDFVLNLASADEDLARRSMALVREARDLCVELGAPMYSVHAGFCVDAPPGALGRPLPRTGAAPPDEAAARMVARLRVLAEEFAARGLALLVENHELAPHNLVDGENRLLLGATGTELAALVRAVDHPALGALLDTGHLKVSCRTLGRDPHAELAAAAPVVRALQVHDNDGTADQHRPFDERAWFAPHLARFADAWVSIESKHPDADAAVRQAALLARFMGRSAGG